MLTCNLITDHLIAFSRGELFASPQRSSQASVSKCNSLPNSQDVSTAPQQDLRDALAPAEPPEDSRGLPDAQEPTSPSSTTVRQKVVSQQASENTITSTPPSKVCDSGSVMQS